MSVKYGGGRHIILVTDPNDARMLQIVSQPGQPQNCMIFRRGENPSVTLILPSSTDQYYQRKSLLRLHGLSQIQHLEHVWRHLSTKKVPLLPLGCRRLHDLLGHLMRLRCHLSMHTDCFWLGSVYHWRYMRQLWRSCSGCRSMQHHYRFRCSRHANTACAQTQSLHTEKANGHIYLCNGWQVSFAIVTNISALKL